MAPSKKKNPEPLTSEKKETKSKKRLEINFNSADLMKIIKSIVLQGKDTIEAIEKAVQKTIESKIDLGEITPEEGKQIFNSFQEKIRTSFKKLNETVDRNIQSVLKTLHFITSDDLQKLEEKIDYLSRELDTLTSRRSKKTRASRSPKGTSSRSTKK